MGCEGQSECLFSNEVLRVAVKKEHSGVRSREEYGLAYGDTAELGAGHEDYSGMPSSPLMWKAHAKPSSRLVSMVAPAV